MKLPEMSAVASVGVAADYGQGPATFSQSAIEPQFCSVGKMLGCGAAAIACGATCLIGPEVCIPCLAGVGMTGCLDCLIP